MILCVGTYVDPNEARMKELLYCLRKNIANPHLTEIHVALEDDDAQYLPEHTALLEIPKVNWFVRSEAVIGARGTRFTDRRMRFTDWFVRIDAMDHKEPVIIANSDIYFDDTIRMLTPEYLRNRFVCLSRRHIGIDETGDRPLDESAICAQDAWVFMPPLKATAPLDFTTGCPGCDNRLVHEMDAAGYEVVNPSISVHAFHVHSSAVRRYGPAVPGPHKLIAPSRIK